MKIVLKAIILRFWIVLTTTLQEELLNREKYRNTIIKRIENMILFVQCNETIFNHMIIQLFYV